MPRVFERGALDPPLRIPLGSRAVPVGLAGDLFSHCPNWGDLIIPRYRSA